MALKPLAPSTSWPLLRRLARAIDLGEGRPGHCERVATLVRALAHDLGWSHPRAARLAEAALVHDIGKAVAALGCGAQPDRIPDQLHPELGAQLLANVLDEEQLGWVRHHHERVGGGGYPRGLRSAIPDGARLIGLAEDWDALGRRGPACPVERFHHLTTAGYCPRTVSKLLELLESGSRELAEPFRCICGQVGSRGAW